MSGHLRGSASDGRHRADGLVHGDGYESCSEAGGFGVVSKVSKSSPLLQCEAANPIASRMVVEIIPEKEWKVDF
jgi:hypothetical protein